MARSIIAFSTVLAISSVGVLFAADSSAAPSGETQPCDVLLTSPTVVNVSGVDYVTATLQPSSCKAHVHTESTVCLTVEGDDSPGQCAWNSEPLPAVAYYPYRRGATYIVNGKLCSYTLQGSKSPSAPTSVCQSLGPSRLRL